MIILPAIDIKDGNCVRLIKGDFGTVEKVAENPFDTARDFENAGAEYLHMVDLDGALGGNPINTELFFDLSKKTKLKIELGGGIRKLDTVEKYLSNGINRVILGSAAVKNPDFVRIAVNEYGDRIVVGIDAKDEMVATDGWTKSSKTHYLDFAKIIAEIGVKYIVFTDISKDGTLAGPNLEQLNLINIAVGNSCNIIASGGISNIDDIKALKKLSMYGTICGKSIYSGNLDLAEAIICARKGEEDAN